MGDRRGPVGPAATDRSPLLGDARPGQVSDRRNGADQAAAVKSDPTPPAPPRTRPKLRRWSQARQAVFSLLFGAYFLVVIFLLTLLVPLRVSALVSPDRKASYLGLVITTGNIVIISVMTFLGWLSDTIRTPLGNRKLMVVIGMTINFLAFLPVLYGTEAWNVLAGFSALCLSTAIFMPSYFAIIVDYVPPHQHNSISAWVNGMAEVGAVAGSVLAIFIGEIGEASLTWITQITLVVATIASLCSFTETPVMEAVVWDASRRTSDSEAHRKRHASQRPINTADAADAAADEIVYRSSRRCGCQSNGKGFGGTVKSMIAPMTRIDFVVLWVATFFVNASTTIVQLFGLYFFRDVITEPDLEFFDWIVFVSPESATAFYTTVYTAGAFVAALVVSPHMACAGRKAIFVCGSLLCVVGPLAYALEMSFGVCVVAGLLSGFGFGYSSTAGTALSAGLLLDMKAKDGEVGANGMGMFQLAILSPKAVVPAVAGYLIEHYEAVGSEDGHPHLGYVVTFVVAASLVGLGGLTGLFLSRSRVNHVHRDEDVD